MGWCSSVFFFICYRHCAYASFTYQPLIFSFHFSSFILHTSLCAFRARKTDWNHIKTIWFAIYLWTCTCHMRIFDGITLRKMRSCTECNRQAFKLVPIHTYNDITLHIINISISNLFIFSWFGFVFNRVISSLDNNNKINNNYNENVILFSRILFLPLCVYYCVFFSTQMKIKDREKKRETNKEKTHLHKFNVQFSCEKVNNSCKNKSVHKIETVAEVNF